MLLKVFLAFALWVLSIFIFRSIIGFLLKKEYTLKVYNTVLEAYNGMQLARRAFYNARFEKDDLKQKSIKKSAQELYELCVDTLDSELILKGVNELPKDLREKALDLINSPRYGLF